MNMRNFARVVFLLVGVLGLTAAGFTFERVDYGEPVRFAKGKELRFPDLRLRYLGAREIPAAGKVPGVRMEDFVVTGRRGAQKITWMNGPGKAVPVVFTVAAENYVLELGQSVGQAKPLAADEAVVWPEKRYRELLAAPR